MTPKISFFQIERLCLLLSGGGWTNSHECCRLMQLPDTESSRRIIRAIAERSEGKILSGQQGYRLTAECSHEERMHAANWLRSQACKMLKRAELLEYATP